MKKDRSLTWGWLFLAALIVAIIGWFLWMLSDAIPPT
jgi:hypothetical protein